MSGYDEVYSRAAQAAGFGPAGPPRPETFTFNHGDECTIERDGFTLTATLYPDDDTTPPWLREDGHGPVSGDVHRPKLSGERVLAQDGFTGGARCYYDFAEACRIARRDGWGTADGRREGESARAYAARAAEEDFERLRRWCDDEWSYVGVAVTVEREGVTLTGKYDHALWGIESDAGPYLTEVANELAEEALDAARAKLGELTKASPDADLADALDELHNRLNEANALTVPELTLLSEIGDRLRGGAHG